METTNLREVLGGLLLACMSACGSSTTARGDASTDLADANVCDPYLVNRSATQASSEAQLCQLLGANPYYPVPVGPHSTQPGACEALCGSADFSACQVSFESFQAYNGASRTRDGGAACPSGYLDAGTVALGCQSLRANPDYRPGNSRCPPPAVGRPPAGFSVSLGDPRGVADHLANAAEVEAASVEGFLATREALARFGAPRSLVEACARAAEDEDRHASIMGALARSRGGAPSASRPASTRFARPLDLALDNVSVGVVRETFGALMALHQATAARDADVRDALRAIADDECTHAELSASIDAWLMTVLDVRDRLTVKAAREGAIRALEADVAEGRLPLPAELGAPTPRVASSLLAGLRTSVWNAQS